MNRRLFSLPVHEINTYGLENLIYGSLTEKGIGRLVDIIKMYSEGGHVYLFDLGCGDGWLIGEIERRIDGSVCEGVEISQHRVDLQKNNVSIWQGDMLEENFREYNWLHANNLCLEDSVADKLEKKIAGEFKGLYISYRKAQNIEFLRRANLLGGFDVDATWGIHTVYLYDII
jgi:hypothetical protein